MICIYKITNVINNKVYIGQTKDYNRRIKEYNNFYCKKQTKLYNSFIKHGIENHQFSIILECKEDELDNLEIYYIKVLNTQESGLNILSGGRGGSQDLETRKKMSLAKKGTKQSIESIEKRRQKLKGRKRSEKEIKLTSMKLKGRKLSEEHKLKLKKAAIGRIPPSRKKIKTTEI